MTEAFSIFCGFFYYFVLFAVFKKKEIGHNDVFIWLSRFGLQSYSRQVSDPSKSKLQR